MKMMKYLTSMLQLSKKKHLFELVFFNTNLLSFEISKFNHQSSNRM